MSESTVIAFFTEGGMFMYLILAVSVAALALMFERIQAYLWRYPVQQAYFSRLIYELKSGNLLGAEAMSRETAHPLGKVVSIVLHSRSKGVGAMESAADIGTQKLFPKVSQFTAYLNMFGNVATLLGLLGTIQGLTVSFSSLGGASAGEKAALLASGISTAMNTTAFGLIVAIPCLVAYQVLNTRANNIIDSYQVVIDEVIHWCNHLQTKGHPDFEAVASKAVVKEPKAAARVS